MESEDETKYKPIGKHWRTIDTVKGKFIYPVRSDFPDSADNLQKLYSLIQDAEEEYKTKATVVGEKVSHGHFNRDGQYTENYVTHYVLKIEVPTYSQADSTAMGIEKFMKKYGSKAKFFNKHEPT
jgi:hypothetical protein